MICVAKECLQEQTLWTNFQTTFCRCLRVGFFYNGRYRQIIVMRYAIWYHLYNLKSVKNTWKSVNFSKLAGSNHSDLTFWSIFWVWARDLWDCSTEWTQTLKLSKHLWHRFFLTHVFKELIFIKHIILLLLPFHNEICKIKYKPFETTEIIAINFCDLFVWKANSVISI